ncbi:cadmium-translocating P-type ATPase [Selenomonadales bacterium OttesenSCG-928-I06]|nr:cadmium-translocating P-type ATPase [Selenomonadales bacterium OttesenSCG-928-I06]
MKKTFKLENLDCANCAAKIEDAIKKVDGVKDANVNFVAQKMTIEAENDNFEATFNKVKATIKKVESSVTVVEGKTLDGKQKKHLQRILLAMAFFVGALVLPIAETTEIILFLIAYVIIGSDIIWKALKNIRRGQVFDENFLMTIATIGALILGEYAEGVAVMLFYQVGEWFQAYAVNKSRKSISDLMDIRPDFANVLRDDKLIQVDPEEVKVNDIIVVKPGERVPLDGIVTEGYSSLDTSALTGESVPREVQTGHEVISGCINQSGILNIKVSKEFGESTVAKILDLVENASNKKSQNENFITKFARYYTPLVVFAAVLLATLPPLITGAEFATWVHRALVFLVISCPCALVISVPLSFFGGIGGASKSGVLVKGSNYLEALAATEIVVFDKTGTLTKGSFTVTEIKTTDFAKEDLLELAAYAEDYSNHPISVSIKNAYGKKINTTRISDMKEFPGQGVKAHIDDKIVLVGNAKLMKAAEIKISDNIPEGTVIHVAVNNKYAGFMVIEDKVKADALQAIADLKALGIQKLVMLTGDMDAVGQKVAKELKLDKAYTELLPADKVNKMEELLKQTSHSGKLVFVGDGINDAPVLARADIGIAMGGLGSDAAIEAADIVIMTDEPSKISTAIQISKKTLGIVRQNIILALGIKGVVLVLGALGYASMWAAVFADVGVSVIAILNAIRALNVTEFNPEIKERKTDLQTA